MFAIELIKQVIVNIRGNPEGLKGENDVSTAELKPCPFCGGDKRGINIRPYNPFDGYNGNVPMQRVCCLACGANIMRQDVIEAIEAWNKRAEDERSTKGSEEKRSKEHNMADH